jgi:anti-sigma factor RsiW
VNPEEVESQLSAMFDGELAAAECELLSRRIDRDERLRARWSRYALIGAAMRSEPVATARRGFASRVSAALFKAESKPRPSRGVLLNGALAAGLVVVVAGASISLLRYMPWGPAAAAPISTGTVRAPIASAVPAGTHGAASTMVDTPHDVVISASVRTARPAGSLAEPWSYVTPRSAATSGNTQLRTELADYIVAHSVYSAPLMRRNLLSALMTGEDASSAPSETDASIAAPAPSR